ncbi:PfkB family carbohydrate kinase [Psychrobacter immobilis]|uniref:PfkB family carbohydrate kinase n=1 Tax=Psychrobacter immobilis TaxID=498 RepID=UPI001918290D|nr:PfkB family carbohydrate kinase [Psychrobacter immobilis]
MELGSFITVVGGVYEEYCERPYWKEVYGSAGRAVEALNTLNCNTELHTYMNEQTKNIIVRRCALSDVTSTVKPVITNQLIKFDYLYGLDDPNISPVIRQQQIVVEAKNVLLFGMIEGEAAITADKVVYDPQNTFNPKMFNENSSSANLVALVLNRSEAYAMTKNKATSLDEAAEILLIDNVKAIIIKDGPTGAYAFEINKNSITKKYIPSYATSNVQKIGSGDNFSAHFAYWWMVKSYSAEEAALRASRATAYYCLTKGFANQQFFEEFNSFTDKLQEIPNIKDLSQATVYLAGPFFTLSEVWLIHESYSQLKNMGLKVFSPYHDIGLGTADEVVMADLKAIEKADILFAICDGLDTGTIFEIGYARALNKKVVVYCESEKSESLKMLEGSDCVIVDDYVTALYKTVWEYLL